MYKKKHPDRTRSQIERDVEKQNERPTLLPPLQISPRSPIPPISPRDSPMIDVHPTPSFFNLPPGSSPMSRRSSVSSLPGIQVVSPEGNRHEYLSPSSPVSNYPPSPPRSPFGSRRLSDGSFRRNPHIHRRGEDFYAMDHGSRGDFIIFNFNVYGVDVREGAGVDSTNLSTCFQYLGFNVIAKTNCSSDDVYNTIDQCLTKDYADTDCFGMALLGHGKDGSIMTDNGELSLECIISKVKECKNLMGKPKLFFIQSCRLRDAVESDPIVTSPDIDADVIPIPITPSVSIEADLLISYATTRGNKAFRLRDTGSPYIQILTDILVKEGTTESILDLLTKVNAKVKTMMSEYGYSQITVIESTLSKRLVFDRIDEEHVHCRTYEDGRIEVSDT